MAAMLAALALWCGRRALAVFTAGLLLAAVCLFLATHLLGVSTDTDKLFAASLPWRQHQAAFDRAFPQFQDLLVVVIDAALPEEADATAAALAQILAADHTHFTAITRPDAVPFLQANGLLFLDKPALSALLNQTIDAQPFLGQLVADPSARGLLSALALIGQGVAAGQADLTSFAPALRAFHQVLEQAAAGDAQPLSWQRLLGGGLAEKAGPYHFVLAHPRLDYGALQPGGAASAAIRAAAATLPFVRNGQAHLRITGSVALADEEFATVAQGAVAGLVGSGILVTLWLFLAVGSWRVVVPILLTLVLGLLLTTGFAALAVGTLNLISVAFAILFVGIAVDFSIQFSVRFRAALAGAPDLAQALAATGRRAGGQILVAALATAAGFLAFVPTAFVGVAELGLIAGAGMLIAFAATLTFLPACLALFRPRAARHGAEMGFAWAGRIDPVLGRHRRPILVGFAALALAGMLLAPRLRFDSDPLHTKNPNTEAMRTLHDLMGNPLTNPYSADVLAPSVADAAVLATKLAKLPLVSSVMTLMSFVPDDQAAKLALIADAAGLLGPTLAPRGPAAPISPADLRLAVGTASAQLDQALTKAGGPASPIGRIDADLHRLQAAPDATLLAMNAALTAFLPQQLERLRLALTAQRITVQNIPLEIARDWLLPDGQARVQALAGPGAESSAGLGRFADAVLAVAPNAGGSAISIVATAHTILDAFRMAATGAVVAIALILLAVLRRPLDVGLVLVPLLLSALLTALVAVALGMPLNFANIIALPLLLGVGVSFNIYFVMNWRAGDGVARGHGPLGSATARAVMFSALTTGTAFGSLALSAHPGTASMGRLLLLSLGCTLVASLIFVPALLAAIGPAGRKALPPPG